MASLRDDFDLDATTIGREIACCSMWPRDGNSWPHFVRLAVYRRRLHRCVLQLQTPACLSHNLILINTLRTHPTKQTRALSSQWVS